MLGIAVLVCIIGHVAAIGSAFVPVVGFVLAPIRCPAVGMTRPLGIQRDVLRHGRVKVILVPIRAVLVRIPAAKGESIPFRVGGPDSFLAMRHAQRRHRATAVGVKRE